MHTEKSKFARWAWNVMAAGSIPLAIWAITLHARVAVVEEKVGRLETEVEHIRELESDVAKMETSFEITQKTLDRIETLLATD